MTEALEFWKGEFGDAYIDRNQSDKLVFNNTQLFRRALTPTFFTMPMRVIEFGANIGLNIEALRAINVYSTCEFTGVEPNAKAAGMLCDRGVKVHQASMTDPEEPWGGGYDLAISKGVCIHIPADEIHKAYTALYRASKSWIFLAEYYNPVPVELKYRGHSGRLFKRDFAGDMLDMFLDLRVVNYGFQWRRDEIAPQDDLTWFLLEKK